MGPYISLCQLVYVGLWDEEKLNTYNSGGEQADYDGGRLDDRPG